MLQDVISLLGIANPQLSFAWQDVNAPAADASAPFLLNSNAAGGEWMAPVAGLFNQAFAPNIFMGDGSAAAGHLQEAVVRPTLEIILTEAPGHLRKRMDADVGIALIDPRI